MQAYRLCASVLFILAWCPPAVLACGHHGHIAESTEQFARQHMRNKQLLRRIAKGFNYDDEPSASRDEQLRRLRRSMQSTPGSAPTTSQTLLQHALHLQEQLARSRRLSQTSPSAPAPIRINVEFQDNGSSAQHNMLINVTSAVVKVLQTFLSVRAPMPGLMLATPMCLQGNLVDCQAYYPLMTVNSTANSNNMCGLAQINPAHVLNIASCGQPSGCRSYAGTLGQPTDMYLYVNSIQDVQCQAGAAAWARPCLFDPVTNRPVMGSANVCPFSLAGTDADTLVAIMVHEVLHALGFTSGLFPMYIDPATNMELNLSSIQKVTNVNGTNVMRVVSPTVRREARAQFGCDSLDGAQMEDEGGAGSVNAHWEYTHYQGELMLASSTFSTAGEPPRLSRLTLALLEDSGWYIGNWTAVGGPLQWARNTGCVLPTQGCQAYMASSTPAAQQQNMFCDAAAAAANPAQRFLMGPSYRSVGQCRPPSPFTNGCGMVWARGGIPSCLSSTYQYPDAATFGWYHSPTSRAFPVVYKFSVAQGDGSSIYFPSTGNDGDKDAVCYPTTCQAGQVYLNLNGKQIRCPTGQFVSLPAQLPGTFTSGVIGPCPDEALVCKTLTCPSCNVQGGTCYDGQCVCKLGWTGADCSFSILRNAYAAPNAALPGAPAGGPAPPAPPATVNVTTYYQQVAVIFQISNTTQSGLSARSQVLVGVLSNWSGVPASLMTFANTSVAPRNSNGGSSSSSSISGIVTSTGRRLLGQTGPTVPGAHMPQMQQHGVSGDVRAAVQGWVDRVQGYVLAVRRRVQGVSVLPSQIAVTVLVRPSSTAQTAALMAQLADSSQQAQLGSQLQTAGFALVPNTLQSALSIQSEVVTVPATSPAADSATGKANANAGDAADKSKSMSWTVIIIACSTGGAVLAITLAVCVFACVRSNARHKREQEDAHRRAVEQLALQRQRQQQQLQQPQLQLQLQEEPKSPERGNGEPVWPAERDLVARMQQGADAVVVAWSSPRGHQEQQQTHTQDQPAARPPSGMDLNPVFNPTYSSPMRRGS